MFSFDYVGRSSGLPFNCLHTNGLRSSKDKDLTADFRRIQICERLTEKRIRKQLVNFVNVPQVLHVTLFGKS